MIAALSSEVFVSVAHLFETTDIVDEVEPEWSWGKARVKLFCGKVRLIVRVSMQERKTDRYVEKT